MSKQGVVTAIQEGDVTWTVNRKALCLGFHPLPEAGDGRVFRLTPEVGRR